jgi:hypothetical protein
MAAEVLMCKILKSSTAVILLNVCTENQPHCQAQNISVKLMNILKNKDNEWQ